jgi:hypothetical protein
MAAGWWDNDGAISGCVAAYQPIGAASLAASYVNLANPGTYDASPGTAPTFNASTGWTFNGTSQHLLTGVVPANDQTWSVLVRLSDGATQGGGGAAAFGSYRTLGGVRRFYYITHYVDNNAYVANGGQSARSTGIDSGVVGFRGAQPVRNGSDDGAALAAGAAGAHGPIALGSANNPDDGVKLYWSGKIQAIAIYNATLAAGEIATLTTLMNALPVSSAKGLPIITHHYRAVFGG